MSIEPLDEKAIEEAQSKSLPVLVDADIIAYRAAWSSEGDTEQVALDKVDEVVDYIKNETCMFPNDDNYHFFLTDTKNNFRFEIAKSYPYKGNRKELAKPEHINLIREYLVTEYNSIVTDGEEADDLIAITATKLDHNCIIASSDKDFMQVPCYIFNVRSGQWYKPTEFEALKCFYTQILTGDRADNIVGLYGIGPKKSEKMLEECEDESDLVDAVMKAYGSHMIDQYKGLYEESELDKFLKDNHSEIIDRITENGILLWLRRKENEIWELPLGEVEF